MVNHQTDDDEHEGQQQSGDGVATLTAPAKKPSSPGRKPKRLPPFKVLLHNDDVSTFDHVIKSIMKIVGLGLEEAIVKTIEAHDTGVALLLVTHLERAELYAEQFTTVKLTVTIEPDEP
ncbi:MAG: ATP-dependent Clp protease adaptor ClpS [Phycisphaerae bacterium]